MEKLKKLKKILSKFWHKDNELERVENLYYAKRNTKRKSRKTKNRKA